MLFEPSDDSKSYGTWKLTTQKIGQKGLEMKPACFQKNMVVSNQHFLPVKEAIGIKLMLLAMAQFVEVTESINNNLFEFT